MPEGAQDLIYLDYNATTPLDPEVMDEIRGSLALYGNPSSSHALGRASKAKYEESRASIARLVNADPDEMIIMSCGTETINYCLRGTAQAALAAGRGNHIVTSAVEHDAVLATVDFLTSSMGFTSTIVPVDKYGMVTVDAVMAAITPATVIVSVMHSNNEVGTINPIAEIAAALKDARSQPAGGAPILFHSDTSQSLGKVPIDARDLGVDFLTVTGHKLYAPKGIGALYVKRGTPRLQKLMHGAGHENGARAGTENTILTAGLGAACRVARATLSETSKHLVAMRDRLQANFEARCTLDGQSSEEKPGRPLMRVNGHPEDRLPNTLSISFHRVLASAIMADIQHRVACSAGAACHSHTEDRVSGVLRAMNVPMDFARGTLRLSVGKQTTSSEIDEASELILASVISLLAAEKEKTTADGN